MTDSNGQYKRAKDPRKKQPVKRVTVSEDAKRAYEELIKQREERERTYGTHLGPNDKVR